MSTLSSIFVAAVAAGTFPFLLALWYHRHTSLFHAMLWALIAWWSWGVAFWLDPTAGLLQPARYCALCLTGCAGVAVLGARRPHVFAWNFVVLGLFAVMLLPLVEAYVIGTRSLDVLRVVFLAGTLAVGIVNYLPTRFGPVALWVILAGAGQIVRVCAPHWLPGMGETIVFDVVLLKQPWLAWYCLLNVDGRRFPFHLLWRRFRDSWGLVWGQRAREQFNRAAENAGWPVRLAWDGLTQQKDTPAPTPANHEKYEEALRAVLQRFL